MEVQFHFHFCFRNKNGIGRGSNEPKVQIQFHLHFRAPISFWFIGAPIPFPFSFPSVKIWAPNEKGGSYSFSSFFEEPCVLDLENGDGNGIGTMNWGRWSNSICMFVQLLGISNNFQEFPSKTEMEMDVDFQWTGGWRVIDDRKTAAKTHHNQLKETFLETKMWHKTDKAIVLSVFCHILKKVFVHFCFLSVFCYIFVQFCHIFVFWNSIIFSFYQIFCHIFVKFLWTIVTFPSHF